MPSISSIRTSVTTTSYGRAASFARHSDGEYAASATYPRERSVSQPLPFAGGTTTPVDQSRVDITPEPVANARALPATSTVQELVAALNTLGATPRDLIAILQALKAAGALDAEIVVL